MLRFTLFRIPVAIHWWFFLLTALMGGALRNQNANDWRYTILFMAAAFVSILLHELGHAFAGLKQGAPHALITLHGMGGTAAFPGSSLDRKQRILMTAAGPAVNLLLALGASAALYYFRSNDIELQRDLAYFLPITAIINTFWFVFNLCPILPLDGGQILRDLLGPARIKLCCIISFISLGVFGALLLYMTRSVFNLIILVLLGQYTWQLYKQVK